jgi:hypothetical protein
MKKQFLCYFIILFYFIFSIYICDVNADNLCTCSCCDRGFCLSPYNSTFEISDCDSCTKESCEETYPKCKESLEVFAKCVDRDSFYNKLTIWIFLIVVLVLTIVAAIHQYVPWLDHLVQLKRRKPRQFNN